MVNFSNLKNVDLPYKSDSLQFKKFIHETSAESAPYYQIQGYEKVDEDDLTILNDYEFQGIDLTDIKEDDFQIASDDSEDSEEDKSELNFQEYSVSYLEKDSTIRIMNFKRDIIDEEDVNKQAQSSPKLKAHDLDNMIYNLSLDELDFQIRGDGDESLDSKQQQEEKNDSFNLEELLGSVKNVSTDNSINEEDFEEHDFEEVRDDFLEQGEEEDEEDEDSMDIDVVLPSSSSSATSNEEDMGPTFEKLNGFLNSPHLPSQISKIPVRYFPSEQPLHKIPIHQDPIKQVSLSSSSSSSLLNNRPRPISLYQQTLKKSARLQPQDYHRILKSPKRICSPKRYVRPMRSAIKVRKDLLNLIVDAASGDQKELARYGTEINSQNCEGVPLPESTKELVTIPTNNAKETNKAAIIKAILPLISEGKLQDITGVHNQQGSSKEVGFYTERDFIKYMSLKKKSFQTGNNIDKENEVEAPSKRLKLTNEEVIQEKKQVKWAENLEW